jgi:hypothetical protein
LLFIFLNIYIDKYTLFSDICINKHY